MEHDLCAFDKLAPAAPVYLRPLGWCDGPMDDPAAARQLASGACWFGLVQLIGSSRGERRGASVVLPLADIEAVLARLPQAPRLLLQWQRLLAPRPPLRLGERVIRLDRPQTMGIVNITPDSFSDGGRTFDPADAIEAVHAQAAHGAALVDLGAESTRPGAQPVWEGDEIARLDPVLKGLAGSGIAVSVDTRKASVMERALDYGPVLVNDVSALTHDPRSLDVIARAGAPVVLMHAQGEPATMQQAPHYADALLDVFDWLEARIDACVAAGIDRGKILIDPGIGFGKTVAHNLALIGGIGLFHSLGCPLVLGASRKRFIGALSREEGVDDRLGGSLAAALAGAGQGIQLIRAHDVAATVQALKVWQGLKDAALTGSAA